MKSILFAFTGAVVLLGAVSKNPFEQIVILVHGVMLRLPG